MKYTLIQMQFGEVKASKVYELREKPCVGDHVLVNVNFNVKGKGVISAEVENIVHSQTDCILYLESLLGELTDQS